MKSIYPVGWHVVAGMLLIGVLPLPLGYYYLLRIIVFLFCGFIALQHYNDKNLPPSNWGILFVIAAILFNPIFLIPLGKLLWSAVDIGLAIAIWSHLNIVAKPYCNENTENTSTTEPKHSDVLPEQTEDTKPDHKEQLSDKNAFLFKNSSAFHTWIEKTYKTLKSAEALMDELYGILDEYDQKIGELELEVAGSDEMNEKYKYLKDELHIQKNKKKAEIEEIMLDFFRSRAINDTLFLCKHQIDGLGAIWGRKTDTSKIYDTYVKAYLYGVADWHMQEFRRDTIYGEYVTWNDIQDFAVIVILFKEAYGEKGEEYVSAIMDSEDAVVVNAMMEGAKDAETFFKNGDSQILGGGSLARYLFGDEQN